VSGPAADLARRLARDAEAVCRRYLSRGCRQGRYWIVGDVSNTPGRSLYVRLRGPESGPGAAGHWTDAATGEHGDLLDLIARSRGLGRLRETLDEARSFLSLPRPEPARMFRQPSARTGSPEAASRLSHPGRAIIGTPAEAGAALGAAGADLQGCITGVHRTWVDPSRCGTAPLADPRRALGRLLGNAVRFGAAADVLAAGEGLETMLALKSVLPALPMVAGLSANHLAAIDLAPTLQRLYVARDNDAAGRLAAERLRDRGAEAGIEIRELVPALADFNVDLWRLGAAVLHRHLAAQLAPADRMRFAPRELDREACDPT
jgi:hypothetical protein